MKFFKSLICSRYFLVLTLSCLAFLFIAPHALAEGFITGWAIKVLSEIASAIVWFMGWIVSLIISAIIYFAQYNDYIDSPVIVKGWVIVRDLCNMFFILIVLVIAFGTVLRFDGYSIKKLLPKVIFGAIFVNFSKSICGIILDASSVFMLTFVNGFSDLGGPKLTQVLGIDQMLSLSGVQSSDPNQIATPQNGRGYEIDSYALLITYLFAFAYLLIAGVVLVSMLFMLIWRMILIWIYVVLSPLAFLTGILSQTSKMKDRWWSDFINQVVSGPMLAFFIWLSLSTLDSTTSSNPNHVATGLLGSSIANNNQITGVSAITGSEYFIGYTVAIGLLIGGLIISKSYGSLIGGAAGWGLKMLSDNAKRVRKVSQDFAIDKGKGALRATSGAAVGSLKFADGALTGGKIGQSLGNVKDNLNMNGIRRVKDALVSSRLANSNGKINFSKFNSRNATIAQSLATTGSWTDPITKVTYKYNDKAGYATVDGKDLVDADGKELSAEAADKLLPTDRKGKAIKVKPRNSRFAAGVAGYRSAAINVASAAAADKKDKDKISKLKDDYKHLQTEADLKQAFDNTTNVKRRQAIFDTAVEKGFTPDWFDPNHKKYSEQIKAIKEETDKKKKKDKLDDEGNVVEKGTGSKYERHYWNQEVLLDKLDKDQLVQAYKDTQVVTNINPKDFDSLTASVVAANKNLVERLAIQEKMKKTGAWDLLSPQEKTAAEADYKKNKDFHKQFLSEISLDRKNRLDDINRQEGEEKRQNFKDFMDLGRFRPAVYREMMEKTAKFRPDLVWDFEDESHKKVLAKLVKQDKHKIDEAKASKMSDGDLAGYVAINKEALGQERWARKMKNIDENNREFALKISKAAEFNAEALEHKASDPNAKPADVSKNQKLAESYRRDYVTLTGDVNEGFNQLGELNVEQVKNFIRLASAKQLEQIDVSEIDDNLADLIAFQISYEKLNQLNRQDNNPDLVNKIIESWSRNNAPEAVNAININSSIIVDVESSQHNGAIKNFLRSLKSKGLGADIDINDIKAINTFRQGTTITKDDISTGKKGGVKVNPESRLANAIKDAVTNGTFGKP